MGAVGRESRQRPHLAARNHCTTALDWFGPSRGAGGARRRPPSQSRTKPSSSRVSRPRCIALATLSAGEREVLALRIVIELDGEQTARVLGISPTAVSTRLSRALTKLEQKVRNDDPR